VENKINTVIRFIIVAMFLIGLPVTTSIVTGRQRLWQHDLQLWNCFQPPPQAPNNLDSLLSAKFECVFSTIFIIPVIFLFLRNCKEWTGLLFWLPTLTIHNRLLFVEIEESLTPWGYCDVYREDLGGATLVDMMFLFCVIVVNLLYMLLKLYKRLGYF